MFAVLWFDLMFDVQVLGNRGRDVPEAARAAIAVYYARVTTAARPMNRLVAAVMLLTLVALGFEGGRGDLAAGRAWPAFALALVAIGLAATRTVPNAVRLGRATDDAAQQSRLARAILRDHLVCITAIAAVLVLQLAPT